jgi:hypothetical protein
MKFKGIHKRPEGYASPPLQTVDLAPALAAAPDTFETVKTYLEDIALQHFTIIAFPEPTAGEIVMQHLLKAQEFGLPEGNISTLESDER